MTTQSDRAGAICERLAAITAEFSGYAPGDLDPDRTFLELGFDSLFLTQLATAFQKEFGTPVVFRQLITDQPTLAALSAHLAEHAPAEKTTAEEKPAAPAEPAAKPAPKAETAQAPAAPMKAPSVAANSDLAAVFARQLELMQAQLEVLRDAGEAVKRPDQNSNAVPLPGLSRQSSTASPAALDHRNKSGDDMAAAVAKAGSIGEPAPTPELPEGFALKTSTRAGSELTAAQRQHIERLAARYNAKTAGSKAETQAHRAHHADPRTAAGFNPLWKEMVYPIVVKRSKGAYLWDVDDNQYIDLLNGFGPNFFGHRADFINDALKAQLDDGYEIGPQTPRAGDAAKLLCELTGMERVSWVNTGSEAVQAAIRIARTVTGRDKIVLFKGDYHGNFDEVLVRGVDAPSGGRRTLPMAPGIPFGSVENVIVLDYGEASALEAIRQESGEIAAVLVEPVQSRRPEFQPREFLHELRALTEEKEIVLVFDEIITGFRTCPGGAQEYFGVKADLATYGKIIGGGMPIGVVAGRAKYMDTFDGGGWRYGDASKPEAGVTFFAGTFVRHPMAIAAAHASLAFLKERGPALQESVNAKAARLAGELNAFFTARGVKFHVAQFASQMFIRNEEDNELATLFFYHLRDRGVHVLEGFPCYMTMAHSDEDVDKIIDAAKDSILEMQADGVLARPAGETGAPPDFVRKTPLTAAQRSVWATSQHSERASCAFNESDSIHIEGALDREAFADAVNDAVNAHEAFRLRFDEAGGFQFEAPAPGFALDFVDLSEGRAEDADSQLEFALKRQALTPFDLEAGPLACVTLFRLGENRHVFVVYAHHLIFDGYSSDLLLRDIVARYRARMEGKKPAPPKTAPFSVYAAKALAAEGVPEHWREVFADGAPEPLDLPTDRPRGDEFSYRGSTARRVLPKDLTVELKAAARKLGVSMSSMMMAGYGALLMRLTGCDDMVVGMPTAGQARAGVEAIGYCVNVLPLRLRPAGEASFTMFAKAAQEAAFDAFEHQDLSVSALTEDIRKPGEARRPVLFETIFNYAGYFAGLNAPGVSFTARENKRYAVYQELFFNVADAGDELIIDLDYASDLFDKETVEGWIDLYAALLADAARAPEKKIAALNLLSDEARAKVLVDWNATAAPYDQGALACDYFDKAAAAHPDAPAVSMDDETARYADLQARANRITHHLRAKGVREGDIVGVYLERSIDMVASILAVWKAGAAMLPMDPEFPESRLAYMAQDAGARAVLTTTNLIADWLADAAPVIDLKADAAAIDAAPATAPPIDRAAARRAYVIYTSGSTGQPKGVENTHRALGNFIESMARTPGMTAADRLLAVTTISFDVMLLELFVTLSVGAEIVLANDDDAMDGFALAEMIDEREITVLQGTPATWRLLLDAGWRGAARLKGLCGGEAMPKALADALLPMIGELWNMYGPTETTVWSTCARISSSDDIHVGGPIANTQTYILGAAGEPAPPGVAGDLWIGGDGVALGYLGRPELTAERFRDNPFRPEAGRIYNTGDRARWRRDGTIDILGRLDEQVKIRGFRIELGDIEAALARHPAVRHAAAAVREDQTGEAALVAYVVFKEGASATNSELRRHMRARVPAYMTPQFFTELSALPLTNNNKIDRKALPAPAGLAASVERVPPRTEREKALAEIWAEILNTHEISVTDNFFELGGQSLQVARMIARARDGLGLRVSPRAVIFESLEQLAASAAAA